MRSPCTGALKTNIAFRVFDLITTFSYRDTFVIDNPAKSRALTSSEVHRVDV